MLREERDSTPHRQIHRLRTLSRHIRALLKSRVFQKILKKTYIIDTKKKLDDFYTKLKRQNDDRQVLPTEFNLHTENTTKNQGNQCQKD